MSLLILFIIAVSASVLAWLCTVRRRHLGDPEKLLAELHPVPSDLKPLLGYSQSASFDPNSWSDLKKVWFMCSDSRILLTLAMILAAENGDEAANQLLGQCLLLRFCFVGCLFEALARAFVVTLPQFFPRLAVTLYSEMCATVHVLFEVTNPHLIEKARQVL